MKASNQFRIFEMVPMLSCLSAIDGIHIPLGKANVKRQAKSYLAWPDIQCPNEESCKIFWSLLWKTFFIKHMTWSANATMRLDTPLGKWLHENSHIKYDYYRAENKRYDTMHSDVMKYTVTPKNSKNFLYTKTIQKVP